MDKQDLIHEMQLDLGLRSEFESELRKTLLAFRRNPKPGVYKVTVELDLRPLTGNA